MASSRVRSYYFTKNSTVSKECLIDICSNIDKYTAGSATFVVWVLWNNMNNWVWNQTKEHGQQLENKAICL
jgi:hypothetical protein